MRNCFVPGCDAWCKKNSIQQRKMFLPPVKLLEKWASLLPNKRSFKKHDRVCQRHFNEDDIIQFWEVNINGKTHLTPRDKPKLRENAVPCKNIPNINEVDSEVPTKKTAKVQILSQKIIAPAKRKSEKIEESLPPKKPMKEHKAVFLVEKVITEQSTMAHKEESDQTVQKSQEDFGRAVILEEAELTENLQEKIDAFESIYDEAFDVTLPSLLWGIHRDPERKFVVFSEFNQSTMSMSKLLHISETCQCKTFINNVLKSSIHLQYEKVTTDFVSDLLEELDKLT